MLRASKSVKVSIKTNALNAMGILARAVVTIRPWREIEQSPCIQASTWFGSFSAGALRPQRKVTRVPMECRPSRIPSQTQRSLPLQPMFEMRGAIRPVPSCRLTCRKPGEMKLYETFS